MADHILNTDKERENVNITFGNFDFPIHEMNSKWQLFQVLITVVIGILYVAIGR